MKSSSQRARWTSPLQWLFTPAFLKVGTSSRKTPGAGETRAAELSRLWLYKSPGTAGCRGCASPPQGRRRDTKHQAETRKPTVKERPDERKACPALPPGGGKLQHTAHSCFSNQEGARRATARRILHSPFPSTVRKDPCALWRAASRCHTAPVAVHTRPGASASNCSRIPGCCCSGPGDTKQSYSRRRRLHSPRSAADAGHHWHPQGTPSTLWLLGFWSASWTRGIC